MKLKTLKDLQKKWVDYQMNDDDKAMILDLFDDLKAEAVKWVRQSIPFKLSENAKNINKRSMEEREEYFYIKGRWEFIMSFFNLTEEDLSK